MTLPKLGKDPRAMLPVLLALLLVVLYGAILESLVLCKREWFGGCRPLAGIAEALNTLLGIHSSTGTDVRAYSTRLLWILTFGLCVLFSLGGLVIGGSIIAWSLNPNNIRRGLWRTFLSLMVSVSVAALFFLVSARDDAQPWRQLMHGRLRADFPAVMGWTPRLDMLGLVLALFLALAATSLLIRAYNQTRFDDPTFQRILRRSRALLYIGAALLVATVVRAIFLFRWSLDYIHVTGEPATSQARLIFENLEYFTASWVLAQGTFYSLLLAAIYLPTAILVRERGVALLEPTPGSANTAVERWMRDTSITERVPRVLAILSPLLASPVSELIKLFME